MDKKVYLAALHKIGFSHKRLFSIFKIDNNYEEIYNNLNSSFLRKNKFSEKQIIKILKAKEKIVIKKISDYIEKNHIQIIDYFDPAYIKRLDNIENKPFLYYLKGKLSFPSIVFIGSRNISFYGKRSIEKILPKVGKYFYIVSGGALGCDSYSHQIALDNNVKTISVIGTGIDIDYPVCNKKLFKEIVEKGGGIMSIFPFGEEPNPYNFPVRNEIVACLGEGIVIIEAMKKSGTLITANLGLEQGKDIFCVPGDISRATSLGCNRLILDGCAKLITCAEDVLNEYNISSKKNKKETEIVFEDDIEKKIYELLILESLSIDEIQEKINYPITTISFKISILEINNLIKKSDSLKYEII